LVVAADAVWLIIATLEGETSQMLLAVCAAEMLSMESLVTHGNTLARGDWHVASSAKKTLLLIEVHFTVWIAIIARNKSKGLKRLIAHRTLEARLVPNLAHGLNLGLILNRSVASAANRREDFVEISFAISKAVRTFTAGRAITEILVANFANKVIRMPGHVKCIQNISFDHLSTG